jgi:polyisoprenyl-teichoic acid--peptidoglycan teichoic acid transferase
VLLSAGFVVVSVCLVGASVAAYAIVSWGSLERVDNIHMTPAAPGKPMNILLVGSDSRAREGSQAADHVQGQRSDTMMVMRIDPATDRVNVLSLPRDLMVPIADTGRVAQLNSAYSAPDERQVLIDTIQQDFGIQINHWVEVDFEGFRQLVNGIGGVTLYFPYPIRDRPAQILFSRTGCVKLDGNAALAYSRIRHVEYQTGGTWHHDPLSDLSRITRQQVMMTEALKTALGQARSNPLRLRKLVTIGTKNVALDKTMSLDDVLDLAGKFKKFNTDKFVTSTLPTQPEPGNENRLVVDERKAEPVLNLFRGLDPGEISPRNIDVTVLNGTVAGEPGKLRQGLAGNVSGALSKVGFRVGTPSDAPTPYATSTIMYAPGELNLARGVARYLSRPVAFQANPLIGSGHVTLLAGYDFTTVHQQPAPLDKLLAAPETTTTTTAPPATTATRAKPTTTTAPPPVQTTTTLPSQVGAVPPGACG